eukprot:sb/3466650/
MHRMLRNVRRVGKRPLLEALPHRYKETSATERLEAVRQLYKDAFQLTDGRPSAALLEALSQQSKLEGVLVSGEEIHALKFEARERTGHTLLPILKIKGTTENCRIMLESYLDICLTKNELGNFVDLINRCPQFPTTRINQSILLRYALMCTRSEVTPRLDLSPLIKRVVLLLERCRGDKFISCQSEMEITQEFVNQILQKFSFYPSDFLEFKTAALIANPQLKFSLSSRHISEEELCERYPVTRHLLQSPSNAAFPYPPTPSLTYRVASQLENERNEFTLLRSIGEEGEGVGKDVTQYKRKLQEQWSRELHLALVRESRLYRLGNYDDHR